MRDAGQAKAQSARATTAGISTMTAITRRCGGSEVGDMRAPASKRRIVRFRFVATVPLFRFLVKKECSF
ncbi:hypothetical protein SHKM778_59410 [Streptomyces sp. KM77-8]|uniref:Uncharacterized protein n=1 Tax=Streptomyces haneummycinicus TaxID=3074435 RepID=A0AAT9HQB2_9ACTN